MQQYHLAIAKFDCTVQAASEDDFSGEAFSSFERFPNTLTLGSDLSSLLPLFPLEESHHLSNQFPVLYRSLLDWLISF